MEYDIIKSSQNNNIKELKALLEKHSYRKSKRRFVVEGKRETLAATESGYLLDTVFWVPQLIDENFINSLHAVNSFRIDHKLYERLAYRGTTEGIISIINYKERTLPEIKLSDNPLIIVLESVEKPGNLGAVLRTADAVRADAVLVCDPLTDIYNPNIIRSSLGGIFTNQVVACSSQEAYHWLKANNIHIITAEVQATELYYNIDMRLPIAVIMGSEAHGLSKFWMENADKRIKIPMRGKLDSLNVSVSTAIICFEAQKQRER